uniref:Bm9295, isoform g n=1 Tax=Brugia malayi TaxID=6279 RepID=A0A1I9G127_BRUMA|nr:Bm9295, isoform g [Brugia malayi]
MGSRGSVTNKICRLLPFTQCDDSNLQFLELRKYFNCSACSFMSYHHEFRHGRIGLVDVKQHETILPLKITVGCDALSLPPPPPPPPPLPLSTFSILPEPPPLQLTTNNNTLITGSYWPGTQQFYEPVTTAMSESEPLHASNVGVLRNNFINRITQTHSEPRTYIRLIDSPPPPPEFGMPVKQIAETLQITSFNTENDIQRAEKGILQNVQQAIQSDGLIEQNTKFSTELEKEATANENCLTTRSQFKGKVFKFPENCGRPQSSGGRTFPLKVRSDDINYDSSDYNESQTEKDSHRNSPDPLLKFASLKRSLPIDQAPAVIRTATKIVRKVAYPAQKILTSNLVISNEVSSSPVVSAHSNALPVVPKTAKPVKRIFSNGTMSKNGMSWRRRLTNEGLEVEDEVPQTASVHNIAFNGQRINRRLRRIRDKLYTETSHECFEFAEHRHCLADVFCPFDHDGDSTHRMTKICSKLMLGLCRGHCKQAHCLSSHQMPVCDYFLRLTCSNEHCQYLHVKHAVGSKPCEDFNRGICKKSSGCSFPHRYYYSVIKKKCDGLDMSNVSQLSLRHNEAVKRFLLFFCLY